jgi:putative transposase
MGHTKSSSSSSKQQSLFTCNWRHRFSHGGVLRRARAGRGMRPLSTKEPLHCVFKVNRARLGGYRSLRTPKNFALVMSVVRQYAFRFGVKVEQISIQADHCHLLVRAPRRARFHYFFRVVAGQIAQRLEREGLLATRPVTDTPERSKDRATDRDCTSEQSAAGVTDTPQSLATPQSKAKGTGLWKHRPYSRVVRGWRAYNVVRDYIQLNELEALGKVPYRKQRLRGLSSGEWALLWA